MLIGYVRSGDAAMIVDGSRRLADAGCVRTLIDAIDPSASRYMTESLKALVSTLKPADTLMVLRFDHLAPMPELFSALVRLVEAGIVVSSLDDAFSTEGEPVRAALTALGRYSSGTRRESKGRGRNRALDKEALERARRMIEGRGMKIVDVASAMHVSRATIYRHLGSERSLRHAGPARQVPAWHPETA